MKTLIDLIVNSYSNPIVIGLAALIDITFPIAFIYSKLYIVRIENKFKPKNYEEGYRSEILLTKKQIKKVIKLLKSKHPELIKKVNSIKLLDRPLNAHEDYNFIAAHIETRKKFLKGVQADIYIFPYYTTNGRKYFLESQLLEGAAKQKMLWTKYQVRKNFIFSLCHEFGHLNLWNNGNYEEGDHIEKLCDDFAMKLTGFQPPQVCAKHSVQINQ